GAVNASGAVAPFSSYGPASDGRVKPTVASVGWGTAFAGLNNQPNFGNGTSFATPNLAGLITCLWQAFPDFTNMQIIEAIKRSSSMYTTPNDRVGYGIPNFHKAYDDLFQQRILLQVNTVLGNDWLKAYPNPFKGNFTLLIKPKYSGTATFKLYDSYGKLYVTKQVTTQQGQAQFLSFDKMQPLARGIYILKYNNGVEKGNIKLLAQ
ncbi:MAG TPA: S8 family serine peptidase, partial [Chitinophagaceae bacterium]|nr:S8 family serine peptidase [Chitinophagaceae bacterium]